MTAVNMKMMMVMMLLMMLMTMTTTMMTTTMLMTTTTTMMMMKKKLVGSARTAASHHIPSTATRVASEGWWGRSVRPGLAGGSLGPVNAAAPPSLRPTLVHGLSVRVTLAVPARRTLRGHRELAAGMLMRMSMTMFFSSLTVDGSSKIEPCPGTCVPERGQIRGGSPRSWYLRPRKGPDPGAAADQRKGGSQPAGCPPPNSVGHDDPCHPH